MRNVEKLIVTVGLPGSGKTSFAEEIKNGVDGKNTYVIHLDEIREKYYCFWRNEYNARDYIRKGMDGWRGQTQVLIDGLFLTNDDIFNAITFFTEYAYGVTEVVVHRWDEDRETCLKNDGGRREKKSTRTILNAHYEEIDIEALNDRLQKYGAKNMKVIEVVRHKVVLKADWIRYFKTHVDFGKDGKLRSERWSIGGEHGSCYGGHSYSEGEEPCEFTELDDLLDEKCPELTYRHYRHIRKECVSTEETSESEYYGGYTNYLNWVCDLKKMYEILKEFGYDMRVE